MTTPLLIFFYHSSKTLSHFLFWQNFIWEKVDIFVTSVPKISIPNEVVYCGSPSELGNYPNGKKNRLDKYHNWSFFPYQYFPRMKSWPSMFFAKLEKPTFNQTPTLL